MVSITATHTHTQTHKWTFFALPVSLAHLIRKVLLHITSMFNYGNFIVFFDCTIPMQHPSYWQGRCYVTCGGRGGCCRGWVSGVESKFFFGSRIGRKVYTVFLKYQKEFRYYCWFSIYLIQNILKYTRQNIPKNIYIE